MLFAFATRFAFYMIAHSSSLKLLDSYLGTRPAVMMLL